MPNIRDEPHHSTRCTAATDTSNTRVCVCGTVQRSAAQKNTAEYGVDAISMVSTACTTVRPPTLYCAAFSATVSSPNGRACLKMRPMVFFFSIYLSLLDNSISLTHTACLSAYLCACLSLCLYLVRALSLCLCLCVRLCLYISLPPPRLCWFYLLTCAQ